METVENEDITSPPLSPSDPYETDGDLDPDYDPGNNKDKKKKSRLSNTLLDFFKSRTVELMRLWLKHYKKSHENVPVPVKQNTYDNSFFEFEDNSVSEGESTDIRSCVDLEVLQYIQEESRDVKLLDKYPFVKILYIRYNTSLPSSAPVERLFSFATFLNTPRRHALSDQHFESLLLLKANEEFLSS
ncbi:unnamed protein product [Brassicogethes aeneus]|uniref:HAT C-terminal dimerisation domain-containing protein n=1 Tax=Brassicogethes aeneus TaxID=1431903 RepID=A0A9P0BGI7_BRAAE|nr:unnamed protein product [Brassicogethes aeneus]